MYAKNNIDCNPLISIAMATYNGEKYLKEQLDSIYAQTYKNIEVIVTDDCSTDGTVEILDQYAKQYGLKYYINDKNLGFVKNFERAVSLCKGEYIALADQDDVWEVEKIEILVQNIGDNLLIHSDCSLIDTENKPISPYWKGDKGYEIEFVNLLFRNMVTGCTVMFKRELLNTALPFPPKLPYHDWWLAICASANEKICYIPKSLVRYRQHEEQSRGMAQKAFFLIKISHNIFKRLQKKDTENLEHARMQKKQLNVLLDDGRLVNKKNRIVIEDIIVYYESYIRGIVHFKSFIIGSKYRKYSYSKNFFYIKNIIWDIFG